LIVQTFYDRNDRIWKAVVAYGTSRRTRANTGFEIRMNQEASLQKAGLHRPTRFTMSRMRILPLDMRFFSCSDDTPVLGYLDDGLLDRLNSTLELLVEIASPLRPLVGCPEHHVPVLHVVGKAPELRPPVQQGLSGYQMDTFMQEHLTGRANLNGARTPKRSAT
jgi:hypothetical protein